MTGVADRDLLRGRFRGVLLGLAVGEALGAPAGFCTALQIRERYGVITEMLGGGRCNLTPGETSDTTDMTLCLAESLADTGEFAAEDIMTRYLRWFDGCPCDVGLVVRTVLLSVRSGTHWDLASRRAYEILGASTGGNGSLMRCAPVGLRYWQNSDERRRVSHRESTLTHFDRLAGWACVGFNDLLAAAIDGDLKASVVGIARSLDEEDRRVSAALREALEAEAEEIQSSVSVLDTLLAALWAVLHTGTFEEALCFAVNLGGDADTTAAVTGALAGAVYGEDGIPARWLAALEVRGRSAAVAERLLELALLDAGTLGHSSPPRGKE